MKDFFYTLVLLMAIISTTSCSKRTRINKLEPLSSTRNSDISLILSEDSINDIVLKNTKELYAINIPAEPKYANLDTIFSTYDYIPLEISDNCIIGNITKIIPCNNCFCILDRDNKNVFIFEKNGRFRCKLGGQGHGPKEHVDAWNIAYNKEKDEIALLDLSGRKLQYFDLYGNFLYEQSLYLLFTDFEFLNNDLVLYTGTSYNTFSDILDLYQFVVADENLRPKSRGCKTTNKIRQDFSYSGVFKKNDNKVLYDDLLSDTIWSINHEQKLPFVVMKIEGKYIFNQYEKANMTDHLYQERRKNDTNVLDWFITSKYISMVYHSPKSGGPIQNLIYSRETGLSRIIGFNESPKRLGDYLAKAGFDGVFSDKAFLKIVEPACILEAANYEEVKKNLTASEIKMISNLSLDSNPVILIEHVIDF